MQGFSAPPPVDEDTEMTVLASAIYNEACADEVCSKCILEDFYYTSHKAIFGVIKILRANGDPCDIHAVSAWLKTHKEEKAYYLSITIAGDHVTFSVNSIGYHIRVLKEKAIRRGLMTQAMRTYQDCTEVESVQEVVDKAEAGIYAVTQSHIEGDFTSVGESMPKTAEIISNRRRGEITGVPMGFPTLDDLTGGLQPDNEILIAGRPSSGKTALMGGMAVWQAKNGYPVGIFSLEMSKEELNQRFLCAEARVNLALMRRCMLNEEEKRGVQAAMGVISDLPIYVDDTPGRTMAQIKSRSRSLISKHGVRVIYVDHSFLIDKDTDMKYMNDLQAISEISKRGKRIAKELHVPVVVLWQLNRELAKRTSKSHRPQLSDLRGAGEQDADLVLFVHREEMFKPEFASRKEDETERQAEIERKRIKWEERYVGRAELIIGKQRNGPTGTIDLGFEKKCVRFYEGEENKEPAW